MAFNFNKFNNTGSKFNIDSSDFRVHPVTGKPYFKLAEMVEEYGTDVMFQLTGLYINKKSSFDPETPVAATTAEFVNIPVFQLAEVKAMIADDEAVEAINNGEAGFTIEEYDHPDYGKQLKVVWCAYEPDED